MMTVSILRSLISYDPETGIFRWIGKPSAKIQPGSVAGSEAGRYWRITIHRKPYQAHRLAWLYVYGRDPEDEIDHINGDRLDNRLSNLRVVSHSENMRNSPLREDNTHGVPGVYYNRIKQRWYAQACHAGKNKHLGTFDTFEEASSARQLFQKQNGYHTNHGRALVARLAAAKGKAERAVK